jgi:glutamate synthase domain-containing protein 3
MLRQCHLAGPQPGDATGTRRLGCTPGVATQDPVHVAKFTGQSRNITTYLLHVAREIRQLLAALGKKRVGDVVGRRDLLEAKPGLTGKAALLDVSALVSAPPQRVKERRYLRQAEIHRPPSRFREEEAAERAIAGETAEVVQRLNNTVRCVGVAAAGEIAREFGDAGLPAGRLAMRHKGAAGHFYAAYSVTGMEFFMQGLVADSAWSAAYGGKVVIVPENGQGAGAGAGNGTAAGNGAGNGTGHGGANGRALTLVGNTFGYGARAGRAYIRGRAGNRFGICLRKSHEGGGPRIVVEGVEANAFQYMTGGTALVLGKTGFNLGSGMTGGVVYLLDADEAMLNRQYVTASPLTGDDAATVQALLEEHTAETESPLAFTLRTAFDPPRFSRVSTCLSP